MAGQPNKNRSYIFLDLDGVLADFDLHAEQENKRTAQGTLKVGELDYKWWSTMPACEGAKEFYDDVMKLGIVKFLTATFPNEGCYAGKVAWLQKFVPERGRDILEDLMICQAKDKALVAQPDRILIDDREINIKQWIAAGGIGILHNGNFEETMEKLQKALASIATPAKTPVIPPSPPKL